MSLLNFEGWELFGTSTGTAQAANFQERILRRYSGRVDQGTNGVYPLTGYDGSGICAFSDNQENFVDIPFTANQYNKTVIVGIRFKTISTGSWQIMDLFTWARTTAQTRVRILAADQVEIRRGTGTVLGTSAADTLDQNEWYVLEVKVACVQTSSSYEVRINGSSVISDAGPVDVLDGADVACDFVRVYVTPHFYIDDVWVINTDGSDNNDFLGVDTRIEAYYPDEDGSNTDWTPSAGVDHYAVVNQAAESTSNYVSSGTNTDVDTFKFQNVDNITIYGIKLDAYIGMSTTAGFRKTRFKAISGVTTSNDSDYGIVDQTSQVESWLLEYDPNTSALWTSTNLNAAEFGMEVRS